MNKMKIEIWSDIACPYCYIGKRKLDKALSAFPHAQDIELVWHSYVLDSDLHKGASNKAYYQYLAEMHESTIDEAKADFAEVVSLAKEEGLNYNADTIIVTNTIDALRLVKLAAKYNLATEAEEILFNAYFVEGKDVSDKKTLTDLGVEIGVSQGDIERCLSGHEYYDAVKSDTIHADEELNLEFIPYYLLNNTYLIQGSIASEDYLAVLHKAYDDWKLNGVGDGKHKEDAIIGKSCSIDGTCSI